jgi:hypothetical protein
VCDVGLFATLYTHNRSRTLKSTFFLPLHVRCVTDPSQQSRGGQHKQDEYG